MFVQLPAAVVKYPSTIMHQHPSAAASVFRNHQLTVEVTNTTCLHPVLILA